MDIERLDYYRFLDIEIVAESFMTLYLERVKHEPVPEELVSFAADRMGVWDYKDPEHYMYDYLFHLAQTVLQIE